LNIYLFNKKIAAFSGLTDVCKLLIDKGADIKAISENGWTPLHCG
jgi:ankyrin repeat protein